uniref:Uncharacterized protein n=1 Tax=Onchocerca volvulus TaxID=6282 RepID=A0A8R1TXE4_ONCVO
MRAGLGACSQTGPRGSVLLPRVRYLVEEKRRRKLKIERPNDVFIASAAASAAATTTATTATSGFGGLK